MKAYMLFLLVLFISIIVGGPLWLNILLFILFLLAAVWRLLIGLIIGVGVAGTIRANRSRF